MNQHSLWIWNMLGYGNVERLKVHDCDFVKCFQPKLRDQTKQQCESPETSIEPLTSPPNCYLSLWSRSHTVPIRYSSPNKIIFLQSRCQSSRNLAERHARSSHGLFLPAWPDRAKNGKASILLSVESHRERKCAPNLRQQLVQENPVKNVLNSCHSLTKR